MKKQNNYYKKQKEMCKVLGIKPPPKSYGIIKKIIYLYKQITKIHESR